MQVSGGTVAAALGCGSPTNKRRKNDHYPTPAWVTEQFCQAEALPPVVWEFCAGNGDMSRVLRRHGIKVVESELRRGQDFFKFNRRLTDAGVTNPPFKHAAKIVRHAHDLGLSYLALLLKGDFCNTHERYRLFSKVGCPTRIWCHTKRPDWTGEGGPPMNVSWYVWDGWGATSSKLCLLPPPPPAPRKRRSANV
jgi:hypothetical protein